MKILFVCAGNHCSSILSEAITNFADDPRLQAASVASQDRCEVHPLSLQFLQQAGIPTGNLKSQSWDELTNFHPDVVMAVNQSVDENSYPHWLDNSIKLRWNLDDPSSKQGSALQIKVAFLACLNDILCRTHEILDLDLENLTPDALKHAFMELGAEV
ncbi:MAG: arsenate reductase ArsC [Gammaproteobacteria bacterium]|nr:arsenate reductase ArsC [Gammaproteobacteria bacterium]